MISKEDNKEEQSDEKKEEQNKEEHHIVDDNFIDEYSSNAEIIKFIQRKFKRLSRSAAICLIKRLFWRQPTIKAKELTPKSKSLIRHNISKFDDNDSLKIEIIKDLQKLLNGHLLEIGLEPMKQYDEEIHSDFDKTQIDGDDFYVINNHTLYKNVRTLTCEEGGDVDFKYNYIKPDMKIKTPENKDTLQHCQIQILSNSIKFDYPIEFIYSCPQCRHKDTRKAYETASTNNKLKCGGLFSYVNGEGETKSRICGITLVPDSEISITKDAFYYDIGYEDNEGNKHSASAFSFKRYKPGYYECVLFRIKNPNKTELYQIMDIKPIESNKFIFPINKKEENYLFTLQKAFDKFVKKQTGVEIYGLYPIKIAMILQTAINHLAMELNGNIQVVGDPSTGKSLILKYYGFLLNNHLNLSTNGLSISVPSLRGTRQAINLMGKEQKIVTTGYLGTFRSIHIDEAGENKVLVQNLKTFLLEENYSYDKAGATGIFNKRIAQANLSENLDYNHLGQYRGMIRKAYKELNVMINNKDKLPWDESWDLHLPIFKYVDNPYLYKVIKEQRLCLQQQQKWWVDGYPFPLHERFMFYFYLVNEKKDIKLRQIIKGNIGRNRIRENLKLMHALKSDDIENFFIGLEEFKDSETDVYNFETVDKILESYDLKVDVRVEGFYYNLVKISRILNKRKDITEQDYDLLRWFLEKTNCKLDVVDTIDYNIVGPPNLLDKQKTEQIIEDETKEIDDEFGLPKGEFE